MTTSTNPSFGQAELNRFFTEAGSLLTLEAALAEVNPQQLTHFFNGAKREMERAEELDRTEASDFNVFDLIRPDENRLSDVLALLLDPRGAHGQGDLFLRLLIEKLDTGLSTKQARHAKVQREAPTRLIDNNRRRMDVLVYAGDLLAIENKVNAAELDEQVKDYLEHLRRCIQGRSTSSTLIYLTPDGRPPHSLSREDVVREVAANRLRCWSYGKHLREWLEVCRSQCEAPRFRDFLTDFIHYIELVLKRESGNDQD
jgi:hypothetical protein